MLSAHLCLRSFIKDVDLAEIAKKISGIIMWIKQKIAIFVGSRISKFLRSAQRCDDF